MPHLSPTLARTVSNRHGVVTVEELIRDGFTSNSIRRLVSKGALVICHSRVYRLASAKETFLSRCAAASIADPSAVVTGVAAGRLWEFRHIRHVEQPIVLVEHDRSPLNRGVLIRRTNVLEPEDWTLRPDGIRVASPTRAWFDCARDMTDERFERLTEWVLDHHATVPALWRTRRRLNHRGRPGLARVNRVLSQREAWQRPAGSGLELIVLNALEASGVRGIVRQHPIRLPDGVVIHCDGALPDIRWAVEIDHVTWHGGRLDAQRDKGRDRKLRRVGWDVDRVTDVELRERFDDTIRELVDIIAERRRQRAA
ncbi:MAG: hypothetical protein QNJ12_15125 [Ilumatobacter sp.]|uniref:hypothetical protein n=1 Tax=Ilumatobacter sp. TaxID=1967498 RepID=UPI0026313C60|nr:hypothetical protein [Ilumatobacter sp.]MDJ0770132.1 hypothetical protein [Ilumatobacter sp.]